MTRALGIGSQARHESIDRLRWTVAHNLRRVLVRGPLSAAMALSSALIRHVTPPLVPRSELVRVFPEMSGSEITELAGRIQIQAERSRMMTWYTRRERLDSVREHVRISGLEHVTSGPAVLFAWHHGGYGVVTNLLRAQGLPCLALTAEQRIGAHEILIPPTSSLGQRAAGGERALAHLRQGNLLFLVADGVLGNAGTRVPVLTHRPLLRPGAANLTRLAGVPLVPVATQWRGRHLEIDFGQPFHPLPGEARNTHLARAASFMGGHLEGLLRRAPEGLSLALVRWLLEERSD